MVWLKLDDIKLVVVIDGVCKVVSLSDLLGCCQLYWELDQGFVLEWVFVLFGVVGVIFEVRLDVVMQIVLLVICFGNGVLLKGGSEVCCINEVVMDVLQVGLVVSLVFVDVLVLFIIC